MASFGEVLADFKSNEEAENIVSIIDNDELQNGMIAWKSVQIRYKTASDCQEKDGTARWDWLWKQIEYDAMGYGIVAGVKATDVGKLLARLNGLRLIYPDGTINTFARQYLQTIIMSKIRQATPRGSKSSQPQPQSPPPSSPQPQSQTK
jgi:hypothetical protein